MNKSLEEIFDEKNFSARFYLYQKDTSPRGSALYCCQILQHLKRSFPDQTAIIDRAITTIRQNSAESEDERRKKILKAMRSFAATVEEISEETLIGGNDVRAILKKMIAEKLVKKQLHPAADRTENGTINYRDELYFEIKNRNRP